MKFTKKQIKELLEEVEKDKIDFSQYNSFCAEAHNHLVNFLEFPKTFRTDEGVWLIELSYGVIHDLWVKHAN